MTVLSIFTRVLQLLDLSEATARAPRYLTLEFLGLYDPADWDGWYPDPEQSGHGHRIILVNPMTPILDALHSVSVQALRGWSEAARDTLGRLGDGSASMEDLFGVGPSGGMSLEPAGEVFERAPGAWAADKFWQ